MCIQKVLCVFSVSCQMYNLPTMSLCMSDFYKLSHCVTSSTVYLGYHSRRTIHKLKISSAKPRRLSASQQPTLRPRPQSPENLIQAYLFTRVLFYLYTKGSINKCRSFLPSAVTRVPCYSDHYSSTFPLTSSIHTILFLFHGHSPNISFLTILSIYYSHFTAIRVPL